MDKPSWYPPTGKPLLEIGKDESFHMIIQGINPEDSSRGWRCLSKRTKDGKIEAVVYFGSFEADGTIKNKENIHTIEGKSVKEFDKGMSSVISQFKKKWPNAEVRVMNFQGLTIEQVMNKIRENDFAYIWQPENKGGGKE